MKGPVRDTVLLFFGMAVLGYETVMTTEARMWIVIAAMTAMGFPVVQYIAGSIQSGPPEK